MDKTVRFVPDRHYRAGGFRFDSQGRYIVKKLAKGEGTKRENSPDGKGIEIDELILAGMERGLTVTDIKKMQIGQLVDFCIEYNNRRSKAEKHAERERKQGTRRKATQGDINAFFG